MDELIDSTRAYLDNKKIKNNIFVHPIEFNLIPHIDSFEKN
jgi:aspartate-semialdehyde dehydrogenase